MATMRPSLRLLTITLLAALPAVAQAQRTPPAARGGGMPGQTQMMQMQSPAQILLDHRAQLRLTAEQVTEIESIAAELEAKNKPLQEKIAEARRERRSNQDARQASREEGAETMRKLRPIMEEMRKNGEAAREKAMLLLNAEQQKVAKDIFEEQMPRRGTRGGGMRGR
jgi:hypothetical protein